MTAMLEAAYLRQAVHSRLARKSSGGGGSTSSSSTASSTAHSTASSTTSSTTTCSTATAGAACSTPGSSSGSGGGAGVVHTHSSSSGGSDSRGGVEAAGGGRWGRLGPWVQGLRGDWGEHNRQKHVALSDKELEGLRRDAHKRAHRDAPRFMKDLTDAGWKVRLVFVCRRGWGGDGCIMHVRYSSFCFVCVCVGICNVGHGHHLHPHTPPGTSRRIPTLTSMCTQSRTLLHY